jgi:hypothetical protein
MYNLKMLVRTSWPVVAFFGPHRSDSTDGPAVGGTFRIQENVSAIYLSEFNSSVVNGGASAGTSTITGSSAATGHSPGPHKGGLIYPGSTLGPADESCATMDADRLSESASTQRGSAFGYGRNMRNSFGEVDDEF